MNKNIKIIKLSSTSCLIYTRFLSARGSLLENYQFGQLALIQNSGLFLGQLTTNQYQTQALGATYNERIVFEQTDRLITTIKIIQHEEDKQIRIANIMKGEKELLKCTLTYQIGKDYQKYLFAQYNQYLKQKNFVVADLQMQEKLELAAEQQNLTKLKKQYDTCQQQKRNTLVKISKLYMTKKNKMIELFGKDSPEVKSLGMPKIKDEPNEIDNNLGTAFFIPSQNYRRNQSLVNQIEDKYYHRYS